MQGHISSNAFANTIKFLPLPILYMMIIGLSYIFLFFSLLAIAWGSHCKTIGKSLVGGYFIYPFHTLHALEPSQRLCLGPYMLCALLCERFLSVLSC